jgi:hypothetical protein
MTPAAVFLIGLGLFFYVGLGLSLTVGVRLLARDADDESND